MKRREFIGLIGGAATVWPLAVRAQQNPHIKVIGVLSATAATPAAKTRVEAFCKKCSNSVGTPVAMHGSISAGAKVIGRW